VKTKPTYKVGDIIVYKSNGILKITGITNMYFFTGTAKYKLDKQTNEHYIYDEEVLRLATPEERLKHLLTN
jgi:hypothetical protein